MTAGVNSPVGARVGDFNHDGIEDVVTVGSGSALGGAPSLVQTYFGQHGSMIVGPRLLLHIFITSVTSGDFNSDGNWDLAFSYTAQGRQTTGGIGVLLGKGDGSFQLSKIIPLTNNGPGAVVARDPIRAKKARYFEDPQMEARILPPPTAASPKTPPGPVSRAAPQGGDWSNAVVSPSATSATEDPANAGIRREPELPEHEEIVPEVRKPVQEFEPMDDEPDDEVQRQRIMQRNFGTATRQTPLDRADDLGM